MTGVDFYHEVQALESKVSAKESKLAKERRKLAEKRAELQRLFRTDKRVLATAIAERVRQETHPVSVQERDEDEQDVKLGYYQGAWGEAFVKNIKPITLTRPSTGDPGSRIPRQVYVGCASTGCVAGTGAVLAGYQLSFNLADFNVSSLEYEDDDRVLATHTCVDMLNRDARELDINHTTAQMLDLNDAERHWLFSSERSVNEVLKALDAIAEGNRVFSVIPEDDRW